MGNKVFVFVVYLYRYTNERLLMTNLEMRTRFKQLLKIAESDFMTEMEFDELMTLFKKGYGKRL